MRNFLLFLMTAAIAFAATQREAAEWVIRKGGRVMVNGAREPVSRLGELPSGSLEVTGIDLTGTVLDPKELDHIAGMEHVRSCTFQLNIHTGAGSKLEGNAELKVIGGMKLNGFNSRCRGT
jgi:hypothetical protein